MSQTEELGPARYRSENYHNSFLVVSQSGNPVVKSEFPDDFHFPAGAYDAHMTLVQATCWNTAPNLFDRDKPEIVLQAFAQDPLTIRFPEGQYSIESFQLHIDEVTAGTVYENELRLYVNAATNVITFQTEGINPSDPQGFSSVTVTILSGALRKYLGAGAQTIFRVRKGTGTVLPERAQVNLVNAYRITNSLAGRGLYVDDNSGEAKNAVSTYAGIIAEISLDAKPGDQEVYRPPVTYPVKLPPQRGATTHSYMITSLTDQRGNLVYTGEYWSALISINYKVDKLVAQSHNIRTNQ